MSAAASAETVTVAVASNFAGTARDIAAAFESSQGHEVRLVPGSSGKLYAQIVNGAPFDVFLSADAERPERLEADGLTAAGSRRTYAVGRLVVWSRDRNLLEKSCRDIFANPGKAKVAIANPELAPYGLAARQFLEQRGWWEGLQANLVIGENISQTLQFAVRGGASVGLIAMSQVSAVEEPVCLEIVPADTHDAIEQQAVLLGRAAANEAAIAFLEFLGGPEAGAMMTADGYELPGASP